MWKKLTSIVAFISLVVGIIVQWPDIKEALNLDQKDDNGEGGGETNEDGTTTEPTTPSAPTCQSVITVAATPVSTRPADANISTGDSEVDSDDWTSVDLSYEVLTSSRDVKLALRWAVQERNADNSRGDTRIESERTFTLFNLPKDGGAVCQGFHISSVDVGQVKGKREQPYRGERHGQQSFDDTGSLKNIRVTFDQKGKDDKAIQTLKATFSQFTVTTQRN